MNLVTVQLTNMQHFAAAFGKCRQGVACANSCQTLNVQLPPAAAVISVRISKLQALP